MDQPQARNAFLRHTWNLGDRYDGAEHLEAYFQYCHEQIGGESDEVMFFVDLLKSNIDVKQSALTACLDDLHRGKEEATASAQHGVALPLITNSVKARLRQTGFRKERELSRAVRVVWAVGLLIGGQTAITGYQTKLRWKGTDSLQDVFSKQFRRVKALNPSTNTIKRSRLSARYLRDHVGVELEWTKHLPDHLYLDRDGKKLRVFQLVSLLEMMKEALKSSKGSGDDMLSSLKNGCLPSSFIAETLMTITLLFPPTDRAWLESLIKSHRQWPRWWSKSPKLDERLSKPFDVSWKEDADYERFEPPILNIADLFEVYPHWAVRLQLIYEEAEDSTPSSAVGRWADRRKGPRHAYWVTVAAFALAILFGISGTVLSALQLWVSYCQWQVPGGGSACGPKQS